MNEYIEKIKQQRSIDAKIEKYYRLIHPIGSKEGEVAKADLRYIEEDLERIELYSELCKKKYGEETNELAQKYFKLAKERFFADIFLDAEGDFVQKENFSSEEQKEYDERVAERDRKIDLIKKHIDKSLVLYYKAIDEGNSPIDAANSVVSELEKDRISNDFGDV